MYISAPTAFKAALAEADFQRREYIRVKEGKKKEYHLFFFSFLFHSFLPLFHLIGEQVSENNVMQRI